MNSGARGAVPGHRPRRVTAQARFHDEGILPGVEVVPRAPADDLKAQALVELERLRIGRSYLEEGESDAARRPFSHSEGEEPAGHAPSPPLGMHGEVGDVDLVAALPQAQIADDAPPRLHGRPTGNL